MRRYLPAILVFSSVLTLALAGYTLSLRGFRQDTQSEFEESARITAKVLQHSLAEKLLLLESMHSMFAIYDGMPQPQFRRFVQPFEQQLAGVQALQWTAPVTGADRLQFETRMQQEGIRDFMIKERNAQGLMTRAGERPLYFPIYPLSPLDEGESSVGFDLASSPERSNALRRAIATGQLTLSQRVNLLQRGKNEPGFLAFKPLYAGSSLPQQQAQPLLRGLVLGVYHIGDIFNEALASTPALGINYTLNDMTAPAEQRLLLAQERDSADTGLSGLTHWVPTTLVQRFPVADREWELVATPAASYMTGRQPDSAWFILSVGLLLAFILASYLLEQLRNTDRIKTTEAERLSLENQLFRSQKMDAIGRLVGGIAHDFNNLLTSITGYAELALYEREPQRNEEYLKLIQQGGEKGKGLIRKLLSFSRNEPTQSSPLNLRPLIENTLSMLKPVMPARIDIQFESERDLPQVSIDPTSLDQVLVNLCINARDAIEHKGSIRVSLQQHHIDSGNCCSCEARINGDFVVLCVEDSGGGIPNEALQKIFKPFYTTKEAGKGTGLGLSIIHNVTHGCHGHIIVNSQEGVGTQFRLLFPPVEAEPVRALLRKAS